MTRNWRVLFALSLALILTACDEGKGRDFLGKWQQINNDTFPSAITIVQNEKVFHIDYNAVDEALALSKKSDEDLAFFFGKTKDKPDPDFGKKESYRVTRLEAVALNDNVLKGDGLSLRLEKGKLYFNKEVYIKK